MYATKTGFYLLIGSDWHGEVPKGITQVFRSSSNTGIVATRVLQDGTPEDQRVVQAPLAGVMIYPLAEYDGKMKTIAPPSGYGAYSKATISFRFSFTCRCQTMNQPRIVTVSPLRALCLSTGGYSPKIATRLTGTKPGVLG